MSMKTLKVVLFLSAFPFFLFAQDAETYATMAQEKYELKDYKYALVLIDKAIEQEAGNEWYYLFKAEVVSDLYNHREGLKVVKQAIKVNPANSEPYNRMATYYSSLGILDSSIIYYDKAIQHATDDTTRIVYLTNRGAVKLTYRDVDGAIKDFEEAMKFNPSDIAVLNNIASAYDDFGMKEKAISIFKDILVIDSTFFGSYMNLGFIYSSMNDSLHLALDYFNKAALINPGEPLTYNNRGYAFYKLGMYKEAVADINYSLQLYPTNAYAYRNLALVYLATKKNKEACSALEYSSFYGFKMLYGDEVEELIAKNCRN